MTSIFTNAPVLLENEVKFLPIEGKSPLRRVALDQHKSIRITSYFALFAAFLLFPLKTIVAQTITGSNAQTMHGTMIKSSLCGPKSLARLLTLYGITNETKALIEKCKVSSGGCTMLDIKNAAHDYGLELTGKHLTIEELKQENRPAIAFVDGDHFLVVEKISDSSATCFDSDGLPFAISLQDLKARWKGSLLLPTKLPPITPQPELALSEKSFNFGAIYRSTANKRTLKIKNIGNAPLNIESATPSCHCLKTSFAKSQLSPGEETELLLDMDSGGYKDRVDQKIVIKSNDCFNPIGIIDVSAVIITKLEISPSHIDFGNLQEGDTMERRSRIYLPYGEKGDVLSVKSDNPSIASRIEKSDGKDWIVAECQPTLRRGECVGTLEVMTSFFGALTLTVPYAVRVAPPYTVMPSQLFMGYVQPGETKEMPLVISSGNSSIKLRKIGYDSPLKISSDQISSEDKKVVIMIRIKVPPQGAEISGCIQLDVLLNGHNENISIPVVGQMVSHNVADIHKELVR